MKNRKEPNEVYMMQKDLCAVFGYQETSFMLTGFTNSAWSLLENDKAAIKKVLPKQVIFPDGSACAVLYANAFPIRQDNISLKRIQINLTIKEWKVN